MRVLGISGSLRRDSHNTQLLRAAASLLPSGVEFEIYDGLRNIPPYDEDIESDAPAEVHRLREMIGAADAVLIATPEYNHSIPGALKNALDWVSRPHSTNTLRSKPVAVIGASTGMFGAVLIATPEYNHSIPGALKNALDWVSRPHSTNTLRNKPVAVIGASTGMFGAVWAQAEVRKVATALGARVIDREVPVPVADEIVRDPEKLESSGTHSLIVGLLAELLDAVSERERLAA